VNKNEIIPDQRNNPPRQELRVDDIVRAYADRIIADLKAVIEVRRGATEAYVRQAIADTLARQERIRQHNEQLPKV
jgi:hypothetical protein